jgi:flagellar biosynthetic protein FliR
MQPLVINAADVSAMMGRLWWPSLRISGFIMTAPIASEATIPGRVKIILILALAFLVSPLAPVPGGLTIFSGSGLLIAVQEMLIGVAVGMVMQLAFDALTFAGQAISMSMGLGFATLIDPQRGANVPVMGQLVSIMGTLTYLAVNGHLVLLAALSRSFQTLPIGGSNVDHDLLFAIATWGARIFETGLLIALPVIVAMVIVNLALGVVSRAAPQLNLFGIGFTITLLCGFFVFTVGLDGMMVGISNVIQSTLQAVTEMVGPRAAGAH